MQFNLNKLRRYPWIFGIVVLLFALSFGFLAFNNVVQSSAMQRDNPTYQIGANLQQALSQATPQKTTLPKEILSHIRSHKRDRKLTSGVEWLLPATENRLKLHAINELENAYLLSDWSAFEQRYSDYIEISAAEQTALYERINLIQAVFLSSLLLVFLAIIWHLLSRLSRTHDSAKGLSLENGHILSAVKDGLFFIDRSYRIGKRKSDATAGIFGKDRKIKGDFLDILEDLVSLEDLKLSKDYIDLLFNGRVKQKLMSDLNPLREVAVDSRASDGSAYRRYVNINFLRHERDPDSKFILVDVVDVTKGVLLRQELDSTKDSQRERTEMLRGVLHVKPILLHNFFDDNENATTEINKTLSHEASSHTGNVAKLDRIFRVAHRMKGDAGALQLGLFETSWHRFEDAIDEVRDLNYIDGRNMLGLTVKLKELIAENKLVRSFAPPLQAGEPKKPVKNELALSAQYQQQLRDLTQRVARRANKEVELICSSFSLLCDDVGLQKEIYEICIQLVRNSIIHGIEAPLMREVNGKKPKGQIQVALAKADDDSVRLLVRDDGAGVHRAELEKRLIERGLVGAKAVKQMHFHQLLSFIFHPKYSGKETVEMDAGRGVGLDLVRQQILQLNGRVSVITEAEKFMQFTIIFPTMAKATVAQQS